VTRVGQKLVSGAFLHYPAQIHHGNALSYLANNGKVVGDEQIGESPLLLKIREQIEHLSLNRNIESGDRLIAHQECRLYCQRPGNPNALSLASGKFVGISAGVFWVEPHFAEECADPLRNLLPRGEPVNLDPFGDRGTDGHSRVQRAVGILKNDLHPPSERAERGSVECEDIGPLEDGASAGGLLQSQDCAADRRLAAT